MCVGPFAIFFSLLAFAGLSNCAPDATVVQSEKAQRMEAVVKRSLLDQSPAEERPKGKSRNPLSRTFGKIKDKVRDKISSSTNSSKSENISPKLAKVADEFRSHKAPTKEVAAEFAAAISAIELGANYNSFGNEPEIGVRSSSENNGGRKASTKSLKSEVSSEGPNASVEGVELFGMWRQRILDEEMKLREFEREVTQLGELCFGHSAAQSDRFGGHHREVSTLLFYSTLYRKVLNVLEKNPAIEVTVEGRKSSLEDYIANWLSQMLRALNTHYKRASAQFVQMVRECRDQRNAEMERLLKYASDSSKGMETVSRHINAKENAEELEARVDRKRREWDTLMRRNV